ncbi:MAG: retropepsin-like aspartic protease family protein [Sphingomicrobium sp.]
MGKWVVIIVVALLTLRCMASGASPSAGTPHRVTTPSELRKVTELERSSSGHFYTHAKVNGGLVRFLVDTGATSVALSAADAQRVGIAFDPAAFEVVGEGASGPVRGERVMIDSVEVEGKLVNDVSGVVLADSDLSLLGQSYLTRMGEVHMTGDYMLLK